MTIYIKIDTQEYPFYEDDIINNPTDYAEVIDTELPSIQENQIIIEKSPVLIDGQWIRQWEIRGMTEEEVLNRSVFILIKMAKDNVLSKKDLENRLIDLGLSSQDIDSKLALLRY